MTSPLFERGASGEVGVASARLARDRVRMIYFILAYLVVVFVSLDD
jgi:hypothetical protein